MCGIVGLISVKGRKLSEDSIKPLTELISHRGPNDAGHFIDENLALGHRRLSILDLSSDGHQPMHYMERYTIIFNGEIYNYIELRSQLIEKGYRFKSKTDTEVIMAAYDHWKEDCLHQFNGMWAFAIFDKLENKLFCSRDRFGVKPFYYFQKGDLFAFASEIKAFTALPGWAPRIQKENMIDFLVYGIFNHRDEVLFKDVYQLRGGHKLVFNLNSNSYQITKWYDLENRITEFKGSFDEAKTEFHNLFSDSVKLRLRSDVKVGSCLSGGLDSSSIVGVVNDQLKLQGNAEIQNTVSSCFAEKKFDEQNFIDAVVEKTNVKAHKIYPDFDQLFSLFEKITWHQDNPLASASSFAQWCVFEKAKHENLIVMLDGQGADEILAGYSSFFDANLISLFREGSWGRFTSELRANRKLHGMSSAKSLTSILKSLIPVPIFRALTSFKNRKQFSWLKTEHPGHPFHGGSALASIKDYSLQQIFFTSLPMLLHNEDRNSMAFSVESRVPFLDYRLVEFTLGLPSSFKILEGKTKFILREALGRYLPDSVKNRTDKMGFVTPEQLWIAKNQTRFESELKEASTMFGDLVDASVLISDFRKDIQTGITPGSAYWRLVSAKVWAKAFGAILE
jgi:asparagine synthase (glutamine-hydrolysing)